MEGTAVPSYRTPRAAKEPMDDHTNTIAIADLSRPWPLLPLRSAVLFRNVVVPFDSGRPKTCALAQPLPDALAAKEPAYVVAFPQKRPNIDEPAEADLQPI